MVEMVMVVLIIGIIAAVAAPKMFDVATSARENTAKTSLSVVRDAIDLHSVTIGEFPGQMGGPPVFKADIKPFLRIPFPKCPVGNQNKNVRVTSAGIFLVPTGSQGWAYDTISGQFIINHSEYASF